MKKSENFFLCFLNVLENITTKYNEFFKTDLIKRKKGNWVISYAFENAKC